MEEPAQLLRDFGLWAVPVDIDRLAYALGLVIVRWETCPASVSGLLLRGDDWAEITVNGRQPKTRRRFTVAHEIWHFLTGDGIFALSVCQEEWLSDDERQANRYAAQLLMPEELVREHLHLPFERLCRTFQVSHRAMSLRLREIDQPGD